MLWHRNGHYKKKRLKTFSLVPLPGVGGCGMIAGIQAASSFLHLGASWPTSPPIIIGWGLVCGSYTTNCTSMNSHMHHVCTKLQSTTHVFSSSYWLTFHWPGIILWHTYTITELWIIFSLYLHIMRQQSLGLTFTWILWQHSSAESFTVLKGKYLLLANKGLLPTGTFYHISSIGCCIYGILVLSKCYWEYTKYYDDSISNKQVGYHRDTMVAMAILQSKCSHMRQACLETITLIISKYKLNYWITLKHSIGYLREMKCFFMFYICLYWHIN